MCWWRFSQIFWQKESPLEKRRDFSSIRTTAITWRRWSGRTKSSWSNNRKEKYRNRKRMQKVERVRRSSQRWKRPGRPNLRSKRNACRRRGPGTTSSATGFPTWLSRARDYVLLKWWNFIEKTESSRYSLCLNESRLVEMRKTNKSKDFWYEYLLMCFDVLSFGIEKFGFSSTAIGLQNATKLINKLFVYVFVYILWASVVVDPWWSSAAALAGIRYRDHPIRYH